MGEYVCYHNGKNPYVGTAVPHNMMCAIFTYINNFIFIVGNLLIIFKWIK